VVVGADIGGDRSARRLQPGDAAVTARYGCGRFGCTGIDFRILGPLEVLDEGNVVSLGGSKQRALLALLVLHANETLSADRLIDELWGQRPPATAPKTLQAHVSRLRKALGSDGAVVTRAHGYELRLETGSLDAHRFERLVGEGRGALAAGHPERALSMLDEAMALWRGPPLADLAYEPFTQPEIARLDDLRLAALEQRIEARLALGGHGELVGELETLIAEHPYRERLRAQLMLALYRSDRQADALQAYQDARRTLVDELGIEPGERLRRLERAILAQDPALHLEVAPRPEPPAEAPGGAFVGREHELAQLAGDLDDALAGRGRLALLVGEPGIGKSRLAEELIGQARARGARVLVGRCWEAGGAPAYWPWVQSLRAYVREADSAALRSQLGAGAAELAQIIPELRRRFPQLEDPPAFDSEGARFRLFDATAEFLRAAALSRPLVLVLDDLHAADVPSLLLLRFVARELGSMRMLVLGACRDVDPVPGEALAGMLAEVAREPGTRRISLRGLSEHDLARYVELTAPEIASAALVETLHRQTEGNPLFVGETVRLLAVEGQLAVPPSVREVIARRLAHLSDEDRRVLGLASVMGREFDVDALAHMAGAPEDELLDALDEASAARVVSDVGGAPGRMRFAHVLIRDTLYDALGSARRMRLHRQVVQMLETMYGDTAGPHLAELAHHAIAGGDLDAGFTYARRAGDRALTLLAYEEAARLYRSALEALGAKDERTRCEVLLSLGETESQAGNGAAAKQALLEAAGIARRLGLPHALARAAAEYGGRIVYARAADDEHVLPLLQDGLAAIAEDDVALRVRLLARLAGALRDEPSRARRDELSRTAVELARQSGDPAALTYALDGRATSIVAPDTMAEVIAVGTELQEVAARIGDRERVVHGYMHQLGPLLIVGRLAEAEAALAAATAVAHALRQPAHLWDVGGGRAMLAIATGPFDEAEAIVDHTRALGERVQPELAMPVYHLQRHTLCEFRGGLEDVEPAIVDLCATRPARTVFRCALAQLQARLGRSEEAARTLDEVMRDEVPFDQEWLLAMSFLAETSALLGDTASADRLYETLRPWSALNVVDQCEGLRGSVGRYLGLLATTTERWEEAERHFEDALTMNRRMGFRPWLAVTEGDYAQMLLARDGPGDRDRARELAATAEATYRELGITSAG
jgi:DNA-binding SARP family transcriptional activator